MSAVPSSYVSSLTGDISLLDFKASIGVNIDVESYPNSNTCFYLQMVDTEKSAASGESDSPISLMVDRSAVTQLDITLDDQLLAMDRVEALKGRQDDNSKDLECNQLLEVIIDCTDISSGTSHNRITCCHMLMD